MDEKIKRAAAEGAHRYRWQDGVVVIILSVILFLVTFMLLSHFRYLPIPENYNNEEDKENTTELVDNDQEEYDEEDYYDEENEPYKYSEDDEYDTEDYNEDDEYNTEEYYDEENGYQQNEEIEYIIPNSSNVRLTADDIQHLSLQELNYAKNEIYARHGRIFKSAELTAYFNDKSWYNGTIQPEDFDEDVLSKIEKDNIRLLSDAEFSIDPNGYQLDQ